MGDAPPSWEPLALCVQVVERNERLGNGKEGQMGLNIPSPSFGTVGDVALELLYRTTGSGGINHDDKGLVFCFFSTGVTLVDYESL